MGHVKNGHNHFTDLEIGKNKPLKTAGNSFRKGGPTIRTRNPERGGSDTSKKKQKPRNCTRGRKKKTNRMECPTIKYIQCHSLLYGDSRHGKCKGSACSKEKAELKRTIAG